jgi:glycosyltransferase involved in cell wall biosynthesis
MTRTIAVITPAYQAETLLPQAVRSVLAQTNPDWEHWIISDDLVDYEALLGREGLLDPRQRFRSSGKLGGGSTRARNLLFDEIATPYAAILDADDRLKPRKLELALAALADHAIVSVALDVMDDQYRHRRFVGDGPDQVLRTRDYKFTSLSMDSMIVWDRRKADGRYDTELRNMTDLDLLLQLWRTAPGTFHLGTPLHDYVKIKTSMSNSTGVTARMIAAKNTLVERLKAGFYPLADPEGVEGLLRFLTISLEAEAEYDAYLEAHPDGLFEDNLEPRLARKSQ